MKINYTMLAIRKLKELVDTCSEIFDRAAYKVRMITKGTIQNDDLCRVQR